MQLNTRTDRDPERLFAQHILNKTRGVRIDLRLFLSIGIVLWAGIGYLIDQKHPLTAHQYFLPLCVLAGGLIIFPLYMLLRCPFGGACNRVLRYISNSPTRDRIDELEELVRTYRGLIEAEHERRTELRELSTAVTSIQTFMERLTNVLGRHKEGSTAAKPAEEELDSGGGT